MKKIKNLEINFLSILLASLILLAVYLAFIGGYGSDEDTLPMIGVFISILKHANIMASRFTPYPIPELGIGFLSYHFGSFLPNLVTFIFMVLAIVFTFLSLNDFKLKESDNNKKYLHNLALFLVICLSNPFIFFDNLEPIDYSWAFFFFSIGLYCFKNRYYELAILFFGFSIGSRINFVIFVLMASLFFKLEIPKYRRLIIFLSSFIIGGLFYLPIWFTNYFGIDWITSARPLEQGYFGLMARFIYKFTQAIGTIQVILISILLILSLKKNKILNTQVKFILLLMLSNLLLFFYIPAEISYLQPFLIFLYFYIFYNFKRKYLYLLIFINILSWFVSVDYLKIIYKNQDSCLARQVVDADFLLMIEKGYLKNFLDSRKQILCWIKHETPEFRDKIINGKPLK